MISCLSASVICSVILTMKLLSIKGMIQVVPESLTRWNLPSRSIAALWVGLTIRIPFARNITIMSIMIPAAILEASNASKTIQVTSHNQYLRMEGLGGKQDGRILGWLSDKRIG